MSYAMAIKRLSQIASSKQIILTYLLVVENFYHTAIIWIDCVTIGSFYWCSIDQPGHRWLPQLQERHFINMDWVQSLHGWAIIHTLKSEMKFPNFNSCTDEVWEWIRNFNPHFFYWAWNHLFIAGIKVKSAPGHSCVLLYSSHKTWAPATYTGPFVSNSPVNGWGDTSNKREYTKLYSRYWVHPSGTNGLKYL